MPALMELIGNDDTGIAHELRQVRGLSARRSAKIQHGRIRSRCQDQRSETGGERLGMNITEEILQQFAGQEGPRSFIKGVIPDTSRSQRYAFLLKHRDEGNRGGLEAVHAKVIGYRRCEAPQKRIKVRNEIAVFFK
jgi:hypothetical protein